MAGQNPLENRRRLVSERASRRAIELIEINIHDWTRGQLEHLAACASISHRLQRAAGVSGTVGVVLRHGRGHMAVTEQGGHYASCCHYHCSTRTLQIEMVAAEQSCEVFAFPGLERGSNPSRPRPLLALPTGQH